jgi:hypothetical protein
MVKYSTAQCVPCLLLLDCKQTYVTENHLRVQGYVPVSVPLSPSYVCILAVLFHIYDLTSHYGIFCRVPP